jgi:hypothetical protein
MYNPFHNIFGFVVKALFALALLLPAALFAQRKPNNALMPARLELSDIPLIQHVVSDSISSKYYIKKTDSLIPGFFLNPEKAEYQNLYNFVKQKTGIKKWNEVSGNIKKFNSLQSNNQLLSTLLPGMYALKDPKGVLQNYLQNKTSLNFKNYEMNMIAGNQFSQQRGYSVNINIAGQLTVAGVPLAGQIQTGYPSFFEQRVSGLFKFSFDKDGFYNNLKKNLNEKFDLKKYTLAGFDFEKILKEYAGSLTQEVRQELLSASGSYPFLQNLDKLTTEEILYLSADQLKEKIFSGMNNELNQTEKNINEDSVTKVILNCMQKISDMKKQFGKKGIDLNSVIAYQKTLNSKVDSLTNSENFIRQSAKELLPMNGLSRFFTKVKEFQFGQFSSKWSKQTLAGIFMSGAGGSFHNKNLFTGLAVFENRPLNGLKDNQFNKVLFEPNQFVQSLRIGKGDVNAGHSHVTVTNGKNFNREGFAANQLLSIPRNSLAGTFSQKSNFGKVGTIDAEISKSSSGYQNTGIGSDDQSVNGYSALSGFAKDFWQTISVGLDYYNNYKKAGLDHSLTFNYSGLGYSNPGSGFGTRGALQIGTAIKKNFYNNKAQLQIKYMRRNNYTGAEKENFYTQDRINLYGKWKLSSKIKAGVSFNSVKMIRVNNGLKAQILQQTRSTADISLRGKISGTPFFQYTTIGYQNFSTPADIGELPGKMLIINSSGNLSCQKFQLQINIQYLKEPANNQKDLLTTDAGLSFSIYKVLQAVSSVTYLGQNKNVQQLGIRHSIQGILFKRWQLSVFGDVRKNLITNQNPLFFPASRGEIMIQYLIQ